MNPPIPILQETTMTNKWTSLLLLLPLLLIVSPAWSAESRFEQPLPAGGSAVITLAASPLQTMTEVPFRIVLTDASGSAITEATVSLDLYMPAMPMPPNEPKALWNNGAYHGLAIFTMAGEWGALMKIGRSGQKSVEVDFNLGVVRMK